MSNTSTRFHSLFVACKFNYAPLENVGDMSEIDSLELYDPIHLEFHRFMIQLETSEANCCFFWVRPIDGQSLQWLHYIKTVVSE